MVVTGGKQQPSPRQLQPPIKQIPFSFFRLFFDFCLHLLTLNMTALRHQYYYACTTNIMHCFAHSCGITTPSVWFICFSRVFSFYQFLPTCRIGAIFVCSYIFSVELSAYLLHALFDVMINPYYHLATTL